MSETKLIKVRLHDGSIKDRDVVVSNSPPWKVTFSGGELGTHEFSGADLFEAFTALREQLEAIGVQLLCAGARPDVVASGMSRSMGGGRKVYVTRIGQPATELIDIFDYASPELVGSVAQQKAHRQKWIESLR